MKKIYLFALFFIWFSLCLNYASAGFVANTTVYWMHNETDSQFAAYHQLRNQSTELAMIASRLIDLNTGNNVVLCWDNNWTSPNFTSLVSVTGIWNFSLNYSQTAISSTNYLFATIFKLNSTGKYNIANSSQSTNVGSSSSNRAILWNYNLTSGSLTNLSTGERIGIQICTNITNKKNADAYIYWENSTSSFVSIPIRYFDALPNITALNHPGNNSYLNSVPIQFNFTAEDDNGFTNCTLYGNWSGGWHANQTIYNTAINNGAVSNFTAINISEGTYIWNVLCYDNSATIQSNWYNKNYTFIVDLTKPGFILNAPANDTISQDIFKLLNITATDNRNEIIVKIYGGNETSFFSNNSLLYKRTVANNTQITYNWTAPVLNVTSDSVLLMHFDLEGPENATFIHDETGKNNGTKKSSGESAWNESGKFGYALGFDGVDDTVNIPDSNSLDLNESFSISFWAYPANLSKNQTFLAKGSGTTTNYYIDYKTTTQIEFGFYNGAWKSLAVDASAFKINQWNLITITRNSSSNISRIYINGADKGSSQIDSSSLANSNALKLGSFPGYDQNFSGVIDELIIYNKTITSSEVSDIYQLREGNWYWRVDLNDTSSNLNISETRVFTIGSIWTVSPSDLGSVSSALNVNVSVGTLTINNTHASRNVTINITHGYNGIVSFDKTLPFNLTGAGGNWTQVQINVTSPLTEGLTTINFNITATDYSGADSAPAFRIVPVVLVATSANPFLVSNFETYPTIVSQNSTGYSLKASVVNRGQGNAGSVSMAFELPSGWSNSSGALTQSLGILLVNEQKNASIIVNINSSATSGTVSLYANISGQNSTGSQLSSSYLGVGSVNVSVNAVSAGVGPTTAAEAVSAATGGGGGGGGTAVSAESASFSKTIEIVRGEEDSFEVSVFNKYSGFTLNDLTISITGFLSQYISISPEKIAQIEPGESGKFEVKLKIPSYKEAYEEHILNAIITGTLVSESESREYTETQNIKLIIQEVGNKESSLKLNDAEKAVEEMKKAGFNAIEAEKILDEARAKLLENRNKDALILSERVIEIKKKAFEAEGLIRRVAESLVDPKKTYLLTGEAVDEIESAEAGKPLRQIISGRVIFGSDSIKDILELAIAAFERGDYATAEERAKAAQSALLLERKGDIGLFFYLYWHIVLIASIVFLSIGVASYRSYQKSSISKRIEDIFEKENSIRSLMAASQRNYFSGKISAGEYHREMNQHQDDLAKIRQERINLRSRRIKLLEPRQILHDLGIERLQVESVIKKLQGQFYKERKIPENEYEMQFKILNERLAEMENEKMTLELLKRNEKAQIKEGSKELKKAIAESEKEAKKPGKARIVFFKIIGFLKFPFRQINKIKENKRLRDEAKIKEKIKEMGII